MEVMKHALHITHNGYLTFTKMTQDSYEGVCEVWPSQQMFIQACALKSCGAVKNHLDLARLLRVINPMVLNVPGRLIVNLSVRNLFYIAMSNDISHEGPVVFAILFIFFEGSLYALEVPKVMLLGRASFSPLKGSGISKWPSPFCLMPCFSLAKKRRSS